MSLLMYARGRFNAGVVRYQHGNAHLRLGSEEAVGEDRHTFEVLHSFVDLCQLVLVEHIRPVVCLGNRLALPHHVALELIRETLWYRGRQIFCLHPPSCPGLVFRIIWRILDIWLAGWRLCYRCRE